MTFLSLAIEKNCLTQEKDLLEYQEMCYSSEYNQVTEEMGQYQNENTDGRYDNAIASLESYQEFYDNKKGTIESQLKVINNEIEGYDKAVTNNVKNECSFKLSA